jgi:hypothetical protein
MSDGPEEGEVAKDHWWARFDKALGNEDANLVLSLIAIFIVFFAYETDLLATNPFGWWLLAILDLFLVTWFIAEHARSISVGDDWIGTFDARCCHSAEFHRCTPRHSPLKSLHRRDAAARTASDSRAQPLPSSGPAPILRHFLPNHHRWSDDLLL